MLRRYLMIVLLLLPALAQAAPPDGALKEGQVLRGRFIQERHLHGFQSPLRSDGHFVLAPGKGLIWAAEKPFAVTTIISPAGLSQDVGGNQTMHLTSSRLPFLTRLYDMLGGALGGDWRALGVQFNITHSGDDKSWQVMLVPKSGPDPMTMPFQALIVRGGHFVDWVRITKSEQDYDELVFLDQVVTTAPLSAEENSSLRAIGK